MALYVPPDIRQQKITDAEAFLSAKRARRMVVLMTYKEKRAEKLNKIKGEELTRFNRQAARIDKIMERIVADLQKLNTGIITLSKIHNGLANIEHEEAQL